MFDFYFAWRISIHCFNHQSFDKFIWNCFQKQFYYQNWLYCWSLLERISSPTTNETKFIILCKTKYNFLNCFCLFFISFVLITLNCVDDKLTDIARLGAEKFLPLWKNMTCNGSYISCFPDQNFFVFLPKWSMDSYCKVET